MTTPAKTILNAYQSSSICIRELCDLFNVKFLQIRENLANNTLLRDAEILYHKLCEIIFQAKCIRNRYLDDTEKDMFHRCMFACCIEIEMYSNKVQLKFPWILETLNLKAFYFYRVIELIVRTNTNQISHDVVKHLNSIELEMFNNIIWKSDSPFWEIFQKFNRPAPHYANIALPEQIEYGTQVVPNLNDQIQTPTTPNTSFFQSPVDKSNTLKRNVSLDLFFRKFYMFADVRLDQFCKLLNMDAEIKQRIFTCFEQCITKDIYLIRDRYMDQILMCSIHILYRYSFSTKEKTLTNIIECYNKSFPNQKDICNGLIKFYRIHFDPLIHCFVERFSNSPDENLLLSPSPSKTKYSPKFPISENVFVRTMDKSSPDRFHCRENLTRVFIFKRAGSSRTDDEEPKKKRDSVINRKLQEMFLDRNIQNKE